jgi:hypothetical protein
VWRTVQFDILIVSRLCSSTADAYLCVCVCARAHVCVCVCVCVHVISSCGAYSMLIVSRACRMLIVSRACRMLIVSILILLKRSACSWAVCPRTAIYIQYMCPHCAIVFHTTICVSACCGDAGCGFKFRCVLQLLAATACCNWHTLLPQCKRRCFLHCVLQLLQC